jgi:hypothetical protein
MLQEKKVWWSWWGVEVVGGLLRWCRENDPEVRQNGQNVADRKVASLDRRVIDRVNDWALGRKGKVRDENDGVGATGRGRKSQKNGLKAERVVVQHKVVVLQYSKVV